jgi:glutamyl-tRNA synthetase
MDMLKFDAPQTTRMAPSPTGNAHIGFARTALFNYLAARACGGKFILRIDDTDAARSKKEYEDSILKTMDWLGLEYDELHHQSKRYDRYREIANTMIENDTAERRDGAIFYKPNKWFAQWADVVSGTMPITDRDRESISNLVLIRTDGSPTYHFASCVDDVDLGVDFVIRGTDHISNTPKHVHLFEHLNKTPKFAHVGLIFHNGKKISKRDGISSMDFYQEKFKPAAVLNALLKLGWSHPNPKFDKEMPIITKEDAIRIFPEGQLKAAKSTLDMGKLEWLNKRHA